MKKKLLVIISFLILLAGLTAAGITYAQMNAPQHPSDYHIGIKYSDAVKSDKPMLAVFYVDWCGYCLRFMPKFNILSKLYSDKYNFVMINVEDKENKKLSEDVGITGFPTVYIFDPKYDNRVLLSNSIYQNLAKFRIELDRYTRIRRLLDKALGK